MANRYIVHGTDRATGQPAHRTLEAESAGEAELIALELGMSVRSIELDDGEAEDEPLGDPLSGEPRSGGGRGRRKPETPVWSGTPSQWSNLPWFLACVLIIPIPVALWKYIQTRMTHIRITTQRLQIETGVFSRQLEEVELYRVKDTTLEQTLLQRLVGLGTVRLMTSDESSPVVLLKHLPQSREVREIVRTQVEAARRARGVRELDVA